MKKIVWTLIFIIPVFILIFCSGSIIKKDKVEKTTSANNNIVVLELFTSQGCSSCPPADRLLGRYADKENVFALSFHVDYWNRLGWKDPFSKAEFTQRQQNYASQFAASGVYTPQLVINGQNEMVGSDEDKIANTIRKFKGEQSSSSITISEVKSDNNKLSITWSSFGKINNSLLNIALVQNKATTSIRAGENSGVSLTNYNIVRNFKTTNDIAADKNVSTIDLVAGSDKKDLSVILFLQDKSTNKIYAAARASL